MDKQSGSVYALQFDSILVLTPFSLNIGDEIVFAGPRADEVAKALSPRGTSMKYIDGLPRVKLGKGAGVNGHNSHWHLVDDDRLTALLRIAWGTTGKAVLQIVTDNQELTQKLTALGAKVNPESLLPLPDEVYDTLFKTLTAMALSTIRSILEPEEEEEVGNPFDDFFNDLAKREPTEVGTD